MINKFKTWWKHFGSPTLCLLAICFFFIPSPWSGILMGLSFILFTTTPGISDYWNKNKTRKIIKHTFNVSFGLLLIGTHLYLLLYPNVVRLWIYKH